jgi:hypothetical protein
MKIGIYSSEGGANFFDPDCELRPQHLSGFKSDRKHVFAILRP